MKPATKLILLAVLAVPGVPVARFAWVNFKQGWDQAPRQSATRPAADNPDATPAKAAAPPAPAVVGSFDFARLDFSGNTIDVNNPGNHYLEKLPPLKGSGRDGYRAGMIGQGRFTVKGTIGAISGASQTHLPSDSHAGGLMILELAVERGAVRAYLCGLSGHVISGYVYVDVSPGHPGRIRGFLEDWSDTGSPEQLFTLESRDGNAGGIAYRVYRSE